MLTKTRWHKIPSPRPLYVLLCKPCELPVPMSLLELLQELVIVGIGQFGRSSLEKCSKDENYLDIYAKPPQR